jgi:hypothetical protein
VIVLGDGRPNEKPIIQENSYGVALHLSTLLALCERDGRTDSALAWCVRHPRRLLSDTAFTGSVGRLGGVGKVGGITEKTGACTALRKTLCAPWRSVSRGGSKLRVRRLWPLVPLPLSATGHFRVRELTASPIVVVLFVALALGAVDATRILTGPPSRRINRSETGIIRDTRTSQDKLRITLDGPANAGFVVRLHSYYWANRQQQRLWEGPHGARVELPLDRLPDAPTEDPYDGEVKILYRRWVLWRDLPPLVVERVPLRSLVMPPQPGHS